MATLYSLIVQKYGVVKTRLRVYLDLSSYNGLGNNILWLWEMIKHTIIYMFSNICVCIVGIFLRQILEFTLIFIFHRNLKKKLSNINI